MAFLVAMAIPGRPGAHYLAFMAGYLATLAGGAYSVRMFIITGMLIIGTHRHSGKPKHQEQEDPGDNSET
jgi:hypothetical protein